MKLVEFWPASGKQSTFDLGALVPYTAGCDADVLQVLGVAPDGRIVLMVENPGVTRFGRLKSKA